MKRFRTGILFTLLAGLASVACEGPNCFAGECVTAPADGLTRDQEMFLDLVLIEAPYGPPAIHRYETDQVTLRPEGAVGVVDSVEVERMLTEFEPLTGRTFEITADSNAQLALYYTTEEEVYERTGEGPSTENAQGFCAPEKNNPERRLTSGVLWVRSNQEGVSRVQTMRHEIGHCIGLLKPVYDESSIVHAPSSAPIDSLADIDRFSLSTRYDDRLTSGMVRLEVIEALEWGDL